MLNWSTFAACCFDSSESWWARAPSPELYASCAREEADCFFASSARARPRRRSYSCSASLEELWLKAGLAG